jgi:hypothetical protein
MIQRSKKPGFALEASQALFVLGEGFREDFNSDFASELGVPGAISHLKCWMEP